VTVVMMPGVVRHPDRRVAAIVDYFEQLRPESLDHLATIYHDEAGFKDPFNEVRGLAPIRRIYAHMFETLEAPRFIVMDIAVDGDHCWLGWDFVFHNRRMGDERQCIRGATLLRLGADGRITDHRDYWDAAEELYEKLPLIGALMRWLRRRITSS
jgi:ketosteroid isomerase-like protein